MKLSLNIILDDLSNFNTLCYVQNKSRTFKGLRLLSDRNPTEKRDHLTVCRLSDVLEGRVSKGICTAAIIDTKLPVDSTLIRDCVLFDTDIDVSGLFSAIQDIFEKYEGWCAAMDQLLIRNRSIQDILTLSEDIIGNYITISDSAFSLVAYTQGLTCEDPITNRLVENGYHDQEAISVFTDNMLPDYWRDADDIYERDSGIITAYPMLGKVIHYNNSYYSHVVMLCNNRPITPGLRDLFHMLIDHLMVCFERQWVDNNQMPHIYDSLLLELLSDNDLTEDAINARAKNSGLPSSGSFTLLKISTDDNSGIMLQRLCQELSARIPQSRVTLSKDILIALLILKDPDISKAPILQTLESIMERYDSRCGVSDLFHKLSEIRLAGIQAQTALEFGKYNKRSRYYLNADQKYERACTFSSCYPLCIISENVKGLEMVRSARTYTVLDQLHEYDLKHNTNNLDLLYAYLVNERRASDTAKIMHMHRNNVIYRIGKITEMINMDLDDPGVRFKLLFAFETYIPREE